MAEKQTNKERLKEITAGIEKESRNCFKVTVTGTIFPP